MEAFIESDDPPLPGRDCIKMSHGVFIEDGDDSSIPSVRDTFWRCVMTELRAGQSVTVIREQVWNCDRFWFRPFQDGELPPLFTDITE